MVPPWREPSAVGERARRRIIASLKSLACLCQRSYGRSCANKPPLTCKCLLGSHVWHKYQRPVTGSLLGTSRSIGRVANRCTSRLVAVGSRVVCWNAQLRESSMDLVSTVSALRVDARNLDLGLGTTNWPVCGCGVLPLLTRALRAAGSKETRLEKANWDVIVPCCEPWCHAVGDS